MKMQKGFFRRAVSLILVSCGLSSATAFAGPIILGGDDLDYHGNYNSGSGPNQKGWLYIQKALASMYALKPDDTNCITRAGNDGSIAVLGCPLSTLDNGTSNSSGHAGAAIHFAGNVSLGKVVNYYDGVAGINAFFASLGAGAVNPAIIYIPSSDYDAVDGISVAEGAALTAHAADLLSFVNSGGGLMAHIDGSNTDGWVTTVTGVTVNPVCNSSGATLTSAGSTAFPSLSNSDINSTAGPCHATFSGTLGGLSVLALDGNNPKLNFIIGGGCGTIITTSTPPSVDPCCPPWNTTIMSDQLVYVPSGSINAPYTLHFQPSAAFNSQMQAYINYLHAINPAMTGITIDWRLHDQGTGTNCVNCGASGYGPQIGSTVWVTWTQGGSGTPAISDPGFFNLPTTYPMVQGTCYLVHTGIYLENKQHFFSDTCANTEICVKWQVSPRKKEPSMLEISDGKKVIKRIPTTRTVREFPKN